jgi:GDP-4-dehydro-6-deoxy-D-mannose reductase
MKVLITGAGGFSGGHLARWLRPRVDRIYGLSRRAAMPEGVVPLVGDLEDAESAAAAVRESEPDRIFHLAARTPAAAAEGFDERDWLVRDPVGAYNLLEAVRRHRPSARVLVVSSSAVYGHAAESALPVAETAPLAPITMYGVSKATVELVAVRFAAEHGLHVVRARSFNLLGPGEPGGAMTSVVASQVARIAAGGAPPVIRIRHRATARDFTDVRDAVVAYGSILEHGLAGEVYNVCSGRAVAIGEVVHGLLAAARLTARVEETAAGPMPADIRAQSGDPRKTAAATAWAPEISLAQSLADLLASFG